METLFQLPEQPSPVLQSARQRVAEAEAQRDKAIKAIQAEWPKWYPDIYTFVEDAKAALRDAEQRELDRQKSASARS